MRGQPFNTRYDYRASTDGIFAGRYILSTFTATFRFTEGVYYDYFDFPLDQFQQLVMSTRPLDYFKQRRLMRHGFAHGVYERVDAFPDIYDLQFNS